MFFHKPKPPIDPIEAAAKALEERYLAFTATPLRSSNERRSDLRDLIVQADITHVAFFHGYINDMAMGDDDCKVSVDWLLLGTRHVKIVHAGRIYQIGNFLIYITRKDSQGGNEPRVIVENVTPLNQLLGGSQVRPKNEYPCAHPHVFGQIGKFCIDQEGEINEALAEGNVPEAFAIINAALHSYGPGMPICDISMWPSFPIKPTARR